MGENESSKNLNALLEVLLGSKVDNVDCTEESLLKLIELKKQQEITKQHYYQLEISNASINLLKLAMSYKIPPNQISSMFISSSRQAAAGAVSSNKNVTMEENTPITKIKTEPLSKQPLSYQFPPRASPTNQASNHITKTKHKRTNSPARIGANAVALLNDANVINEEEPQPQIPSFDTMNNNVSSYKNLKQPQKVKLHKRNISLPMNTSNYYNMTNVIDFNVGQASIAENLTIKNFSNKTKMPSNQSGNHLLPTISAGSYHQRTRSSSPFKVVDLNQIEIGTQQFKESLSPGKEKALTLAHPKSRGNTIENTDELTYSEKSSANNSPVRPTNSQKLVSNIISRA
ncbi:hypothetical protein TPHA_0C03280 [Tetrapisispora phaffii CBS 4417]|uniref:Uncharacterized protein n=1 Tax=Tetrapisispora phaffii (strain ATCC 24235 / CBS 4417 / NBRC 1672 / NRRL Y-8282 / UCD 70-5) TaxID=1071381 RepID=G8BRV4_TETPH|nr:hypothetical protein TPHA_0C03280 [Tetrapisispora phaffii CBS 4417]CCE62480.1 hypothetical protein TPHA_0C03280 [Tetrapisispora phaffii CBS 4417]